MIAGIYNILCEQGATFERTFTITNPDGTVYDLTGFSGRMHIRKDASATTYYFSLTTSNGHMEIFPQFGEINIRMSATETAANFTRDGYYDLEIFNADGVVYRVLKGAFKLDKEITR